MARLKSEVVFKELSLNYQTSEEEEVAKVNFVAFGKAVESQLHVQMSSSVDRRLSFGGRFAVQKVQGTRYFSTNQGWNGGLNCFLKHEVFGCF